MKFNNYLSKFIYNVIVSDDNSVGGTYTPPPTQPSFSPATVTQGSYMYSSPVAAPTYKSSQVVATPDEYKPPVTGMTSYAPTPTPVSSVSPEMIVYRNYVPQPVSQPTSLAVDYETGRIYDTTNPMSPTDVTPEPVFTQDNTGMFKLNPYAQTSEQLRAEESRITSTSKQLVPELTLFKTKWAGNLSGGKFDLSSKQKEKRDSMLASYKSMWDPYMKADETGEQKFVEKEAGDYTRYILATDVLNRNLNEFETKLQEQFNTYRSEAKELDSRITQLNDQSLMLSTKMNAFNIGIQKTNEIGTVAKTPEGKYKVEYYQQELTDEDKALGIRSKGGGSALYSSKEEAEYSARERGGILKEVAPIEEQKVSFWNRPIISVESAKGNKFLSWLSGGGGSVNSLGTGGTVSPFSLSPLGVMTAGETQLLMAGSGSVIGTGSKIADVGANIFGKLYSTGFAAYALDPREKQPLYIKALAVGGLGAGFAPEISAIAKTTLSKVSSKVPVVSKVIGEDQGLIASAKKVGETKTQLGNVIKETYSKELEATRLAKEYPSISAYGSTTEPRALISSSSQTKYAIAKTNYEKALESLKMKMSETPTITKGTLSKVEQYSGLKGLKSDIVDLSKLKMQQEQLSLMQQKSIGLKESTQAPKFLSSTKSYGQNVIDIKKTGISTAKIETGIPSKISKETPIYTRTISEKPTILRGISAEKIEVTSPKANFPERPIVTTTKYSGLINPRATISEDFTQMRLFGSSTGETRQLSLFGKTEEVGLKTFKIDTKLVSRVNELNKRVSEKLTSLGEKFTPVTSHPTVIRTRMYPYETIRTGKAIEFPIGVDDYPIPSMYSKITDQVRPIRTFQTDMEQITLLNQPKNISSKLAGKTFKFEEPVYKVTEYTGIRVTPKKVIPSSVFKVQSMPNPARKGLVFDLSTAKSTPKVESKVNLLSTAKEEGISLKTEETPLRNIKSKYTAKELPLQETKQTQTVLKTKEVSTEITPKVEETIVTPKIGTKIKVEPKTTGIRSIPAFTIPNKEDSITIARGIPYKKTKVDVGLISNVKVGKIASSESAISPSLKLSDATDRSTAFVKSTEYGKVTLTPKPDQDKYPYVRYDNETKTTVGESIKQGTGTVTKIEVPPKDDIKPNVKTIEITTKTTPVVNIPGTTYIKSNIIPVVPPILPPGHADLPGPGDSKGTSIPYRKVRKLKKELTTIPTLRVYMPTWDLDSGGQPMTVLHREEKVVTPKQRMKAGAKEISTGYYRGRPLLNHDTGRVV